MPLDHAEFVATIAGPLGGFFLACALINVVAALTGAVRGRPAWLGWLAAAALFGVLGAWSLGGDPWLLPASVEWAINAALTPVTFTIGFIALLAAAYHGRRVWVRPIVAFALLNVALLIFGLCCTDRDFAALVARPDNVAIVGMVFLFGFFLWAAAWQAVRNDERLAAGEPPDEAQFDGKATTWPDLVYIELITTVLVIAGLIVWSIALPAPLEQPANPAVTPNPSKAPWYFVGLQELLVYADAWYVGVVVPLLMVVGLMAIPYLDPNPRGNGYYTVNERPLAIKSFLLGVMVFWLMLILIGTFMRGPNWTFTSPLATHDAHLIVPHENVTLSELFWVRGLGAELPKPPRDANGLSQFATIVWRELPGLIVLALYFIGLPWLLAVTWLKRLRQQMGRTRYIVMVTLLLVMFTLPLKMILRWTLNLSYLVAIPEWALSL